MKLSIIFIGIISLLMVGLIGYLMYVLIVNSKVSNSANNIAVPSSISTYDPATASKAYALINANNNAVQQMKSNTPLSSINIPGDFGNNEAIIAALAKP